MREASGAPLPRGHGPPGHGIAQVIVDEYDGETASIWTTAKSGETLYK